MQLITGGMGFIGLHTARALVHLEENCVLATASGTIRRPAFIADEIGKRIFPEKLDVSDLGAIRALKDRYPITGIIHLSGASNEGSCEAMRRNTLHLLNVLQAAQDWCLTRVSIASTIGVYAGVTNHSGPLREDLPLPMTAFHPMPSLKKVSELVAASVAGSAGFEAVHFRFGAWGPLFHHPPSPMNVFSQIVRAAVRGESLDFTSPQSRAYAEDGVDLAYVKDCGRAIALLQMAPRLRYSTYNIGTGSAIRNRDFVEAVCRVVPSANFELPSGSNPRTGGLFHLDISRIREDTGYQPEYHLDRAIADYVSWLRAGNPT